MIMIIVIIAITYIFLSYEIFDQQLIPSHPPHSTEKVHLSVFTHSPTRNSKSSSPPLFANIENFSGSSCRKGMGE